MFKHRLIFGLCILLIAFSSCRPKGVLSKGEMEDLLFDLHLAEALSNGEEEEVPVKWKKGLNNDYFSDLSLQSVLRKYDVSEETFYASVAYYSEHLELYVKIYAKVEDRMRKFITDIDDWKYNSSTEAILEHLSLDTLKLQEWYTNMLYKRDTIPVKKIYLTADSLPSYARWLSRQWLKDFKVDTMMVMLKDSSGVSIDDTSYIKHSTVKPDSISKSLADSVSKNMEIPRQMLMNKLGTPLVVEGNTTPVNYRQAESNEAIRRRFKDRINQEHPSK